MSQIPTPFIKKIIIILNKLGIELFQSHFYKMARISKSIKQKVD